MKTRLVYFFYLPERVEGDFMRKILNLHLFLLKEYCKKFNEIVLCISENERNFSREKKIIEFILSVSQITKISIIFEKNNKNIRECNFFKTYIVDKLGEYDGLTFFAHNKGVTNSSYDNENIFQWVTFMYYQNIEFFDEILEKFQESVLCTYGTFLENGNQLLPKHKWWYAGSFFWLYDKRIKQRIMLDNVPNIECLDRFYAESYLGNILPYETIFVGSRGNYFYNISDLYNEAKDTIPQICNSEWYKDFIIFYNKTIEMSNKCNLIQEIYEEV